VLGAIGDPSVPDWISLRELLLAIRMSFQQYVNLRPVRLLPGVRSPLANKGPEHIRFTVVRENTEGEYAGLGGRIHRGTDMEAAVETSYFSRRGIERVVRYAFELAQRTGVGLTSVTKSNALGHSMSLWDEVVREVAQEFPEVPVDSLLVDAAAMFFVRRPERFGVVVASNLFGDILTDLSAIVTGSMGLAASANINPERNYPSMFEPVHGSAPDIADKGIANPLAAILSAGMLLDHLGLSSAAAAVRRAVAAVLKAGKVRTPDLGGSARTTEVGDAVLAAL
jgi:tartrate dehydrogenase/decarboxylase/D-malate dehydrogenase